jgi:hypothetical protein
MKKKAAIEALVKRALDNPDAFAAIASRAYSEFYPRPASSAALFDKLPDVMKKRSLVLGLILSSGSGGGLAGLFGGSNGNTTLGDIERHLRDISAVRALDFLEKVKAALPNQRYPLTNDEAQAISDRMLEAEETNSPETAELRECVRVFPAATEDLAEELQSYLKENQAQFVEALWSSQPRR